jgi:hypothetical protein
MAQDNTARLEELGFIGSGPVRSLSQMKDFFEKFRKEEDQMVPACYGIPNSSMQHVQKDRSYYIVGTRDQIKRTLRLDFTVEADKATLYLRAVHTTALKHYVKKTVELLFKPSADSSLVKDANKVIDHFKSMMTGCYIVQVGEWVPGTGDHSEKHYLPTKNSKLPFHLIWSLLVNGNLIR